MSVPRQSYAKHPSAYTASGFEPPHWQAPTSHTAAQPSFAPPRRTYTAAQPCFEPRQTAAQPFETHHHTSYTAAQPFEARHHSAYTAAQPSFEPRRTVAPVYTAARPSFEPRHHSSFEPPHTAAAFHRMPYTSTASMFQPVSRTTRTQADYLASVAHEGGDFY